MIRLNLNHLVLLGGIMPGDICRLGKPAHEHTITNGVCSCCTQKVTNGYCAHCNIDMGADHGPEGHDGGTDAHEPHLIDSIQPEAMHD